MGEKRYFTWFSLIAYLTFISGCTGVQTFTSSARPGETIAIAAGWNQKITRNDLTVTIRPQTGAPTIYSPGDARVRTIVQGYADPVSKLVVSDRANMTYPNAGFPVYDGSGAPPTYNALGSTLGNLVRHQTGQTNNWFLTSVFIDLPTTISPGLATVELASPAMQSTPAPTTIEVLPLAAGSSNEFIMSDTGIGAMIRAAERAPHYIVKFAGPSDAVPHSIQIDLDRSVGPTGNSWVTHGRGDISNISWADNGTLIKVLQTPVTGKTTSLLSDFDFYVTGAVTALSVNSVKAYDIDGNPLSGFSASLQYINN